MNLSAFRKESVLCAELYLESSFRSVLEPSDVFPCPDNVQITYE